MLRCQLLCSCSSPPTPIQSLALPRELVLGKSNFCIDSLWYCHANGRLEQGSLRLVFRRRPLVTLKKQIWRRRARFRGSRSLWRMLRCWVMLLDGRRTVDWREISLFG